MMDYNRLMLVLGQCVVVVTLGALVGAGHNSSITDALLAICGSVAGVGAYQVIKRRGQ